MEKLPSEFLEDIPNGRSYLDAVSMVAGVAGLEEPFHREDDNFGHNNSEYTFFHVHGADSTDNVYLLDGLETTDVATGRSGMAVPWEAIQSVEVLTGGMPAEYGRATGGVVNVVTRSGGNKLHGSLPVYYTDKGLKRDTDEDHAYEEEEFDELEWGASLGGRVVRDRLWFFATYNRFTRTIEGINYDDEVIEREEEFDEGLANLTWQVNPDNKLRAQYAATSAVWDSRDAMSESLQPSAYGQQENGGTLWQLQWTSIFSPNLFLEARMGRHEATHTVGPANAGFYDPRFVDQQYGAGTIIYGNVSSITDVKRPRMQYEAAFNYYVGDWAGEHNFKFGAEYQDLEYQTDLIYPDAYTINRPRDAAGNERPDQWVEASDVNYLDTGKILTLFVQDSWTWRMTGPSTSACGGKNKSRRTMWANRSTALTTCWRPASVPPGTSSVTAVHGSSPTTAVTTTPWAWRSLRSSTVNSRRPGVRKATTKPVTGKKSITPRGTRTPPRWTKTSSRT